MLKQIIIPYGYGQTCNQLFQIAHWIPVAKEYDIPLHFPGFKRYGALFTGTQNSRGPCFPGSVSSLRFSKAVLSQLCSYMARIPHIDIALFFKFAGLLPGVVTVSVDDSGISGSTDPRTVIADVRIASSESLWVEGWLYRDYAGIAKHKTLIKDFFSPVRDIQNRVDACARESKKDNVLLVGIHLRRGDYKKFADGRYYYSDIEVCRLMKQMSKLLPERHIRFLLVSNTFIDIKNYNGYDIVMGPGDPVGDLFTLAKCDYIMGPPSTFTSWASFYGDVPLFTIKDISKSLCLDGVDVCKG
jgi:hypothetical protein